MLIKAWPALLCTTLLLQWEFTASAQEKTINGRVTNSGGEALLSASVKLVDEQSTILRFAITNQQGAFTLEIPAHDPALPLWLEVSYIGYQQQRKRLVADQTSYSFALVADTTTLREVTVKSKPVVELSGDTLRYYVSSFAAKEDRSIGDVLRRMPGIEVAADGSIYYNGKQIENLYIHGDDLMNGRYGLATRVIRKEMILSVDVIRNHQPIQVLKDKVLTDKTALNLVLKDENSLKMSAQLMVGAGLPEQYDLSFTPILLNKRIKMINTIAFNNSGVDYRNDFKQSGSSGFMSSLSNPASDVALSLATVGPPDLPLSNYYFNRSGVVNLNNIYNTSKGVQFKANIQGFVDKNSLAYFSRVDNYLTNDTISYREQQSPESKPLLLNTSFTVMVNRPRYFFSNNTRANFSKETNKSFMSFNDYSFAQSVHKNVQEASNDLTWIPAFKGRGIGELRWLINYTHSKQLLDIGEGYYADIKDQEGYYDHVLQRSKTPIVFSNAYFGYKLPGAVFSQEYKVGFIAEQQRLNTSLEFVKDEQANAYTGDAGNDLRWNKSQTYLSTEYQLKLSRFRSTVQLPLTYQHIRYSQPDYQLNTRNKDLLFNPSVTMRYDLTPEQYLTASYKTSNTFGNITGVYRGAVLQNYRSLQANDAGLQEKRTHSSAVNYEYQKSIRMLFVNAGIAYDHIIAQSLLSAVLSDNIQKTVFLPYRNTQTNIVLNAGFSQYLFGLKSTLSVKSRVNRFKYVQLINGELLPFYSDGLSISGKLIKKLFETVSFTYQPGALWSATRLQDSKAGSNALLHRAFRFDERITLGFTAAKKFYTEVLATHSYSNQSNNNGVQYLFLDAKVRYSKKGMDLNLSVNNLFNRKDYTRYSISANQLVIDQYTIRGRMAVLRLDCYF